METRRLKRSNDVDAHLVKLYGVYKSFKKGTANEKKLIKSIDKLLKLELSPSEQEIISDIIIGILRESDASLKVKISESLANKDTAPLRLLLYVVNQKIEIAAPVLMRSKALNDLDLIYTIKAKTSEYWYAIAKRNHLSELVRKELAMTRDDNVLALLVEPDFLYENDVEFKAKLKKIDACPLPAIHESEIQELKSSIQKDFLRSSFQGLCIRSMYSA